MTWSKEVWKNVAMCADAADCSYEDEAFIRTWDRFEHVAIFESTSDPLSWRGHYDRAILLRRGTSLVLAFRGTVARPYWRSEWATNLDCRYGGGTSGSHRGFYRAVDRVWGGLHAAIRGQSASELFVTGHSKGAGMAAVAAARLIQEGVQGVRLITFSEPPVYNPFAMPHAWKALHDAGLREHRRLIHTVDFLPIVSMFFPNHSSLAVLDRRNRAVFRRLNPLEMLLRAAIEGYVDTDPAPLISRHGIGGYRELSYRCAGFQEFVPLPRYASRAPSPVE